MKWYLVKIWTTELAIVILTILYGHKSPTAMVTIFVVSVLSCLLLSFRALERMERLDQ